MSNDPVIDPDEIIIEAGDSDPPDQRFNFRLPSHCVKSIVARLAQEGQPHEGPALFRLLAQVCLDECIGRFELSPIWGPFMIPQKDAPQLTPEDDFCFSAMLDDAPKPQWPAFGELKLDRPVMEVDAAMIDAELYEQQLDAGTGEPSTAPLKRGDEALATLTMVLVQSDQPLVDAVKATIRLPAAGREALVNGLAIQGLGEAMQGMSAGESRDFDATVPVGLGGEEHAGQPIRCTIAVQSTQRLKPASVQDVIARFGSPSEATLRQQIQQSLQQRFDREQQQYMVDQVFALLLEQVECSVPERVVAKAVAQQQRGMMAAMKEQGHDETKAKSMVESASDRMVATATEQARRSTLCTLLQWRFKIQVSEADIQERVRMLASMRGARPEQVRKEMVDSGRIDAVAKQVFEVKIVNRILGEATVQDVPAKDAGCAGV